MNKLTAAYVAGLVDGEGYIGVLQNRRGNRKEFHSARDYIFYPVLKIANTNQEIILWLKNSFGGYVDKRTFSLGNRKMAYGWTLVGKNLTPFIRVIRPYLKIKSKQADIILRLNYNTERGERLSENEYQRRFRACIEIKKLNYRGKTVQPERLSKPTA